MPSHPAFEDEQQLAHRRMRLVLRLFETPRRQPTQTDQQQLQRLREALQWTQAQRKAQQRMQEQLLHAAEKDGANWASSLIGLSLMHRHLASEETALLALTETASDISTDTETLLARASTYAQRMLAYLDDAERRLLPILATHADRLDKAAIPASDSLFDSASNSEFPTLREHLLSQVERVPGKGSLRYAVLGAALAETVGLLRGQFSEFVDQQRRHGREQLQLAGRHAQRIGAASAKATPAIAQQALQQQTQTTLRQSRQLTGLLRSDLKELRSAFGDLRQTIERTRKRGTPLRGPSWQCQLFNLATRASVKQSMRTAKNFEELHFALRRIGRGRAPEDFWFEGHRFRADWQDAPEATRNRVILYFCGGGFITPPSKFHDGLALRLAKAAAAPVFTVHYRLLPDHPFPAALDDAVAAYRFLLQSGYRASEIVVAGDSAGGCLSLSLLLSLRDRGLPLPAAAAVLSPLTDLSCSGRSRTRNRWHDPLTAAQEPDLLAPHYLPAGVAVDDPIASPLFGDYHGLPPILAQVGSTEILLDDVLRLAPRARASAVDFRVQVWPGLPHCWPVFGFLPEADAAVQEIAAHFVEHWGSQAQAT